MDYDYEDRIMDKRFLDLLYKKRSEALIAQTKLNSQKDFNSAYDREMHNRELTASINWIKIIDEIIECYIGD